MKRRGVIISTVVVLLLCAVFIILTNRNKVSAYSEELSAEPEEDFEYNGDNTLPGNDSEEHEYLEEKIAGYSTSDEMITEHRYYEHGEDKALPEDDSEEHEYPEEKIAVQSASDEMIIEHEYIK